uniref:Lipid-binding serum glycoprotein N-terminal domain-containing protein n=1 Tax=Strigamia maritima TaxID=126957 RepID=T1ISX3_STRMM
MKLIVFGLILTIVYTSLGAPATPKPLSKIEKKIIAEVEKFKAQMKDGLPEANIPPMEPLNVPNQDLGPLKLGGLVTFTIAKIKNCQVVGLSDFTIDHIKLNIMMMKVNINMTFSHVNVKGQYDIDGKAVGIIPIYGRGPFEASIHKTRVSANAVLGTKDKKMQIESLVLHADVDDVTLNLEGLLGGGSLGNEINGMLQQVASKLARNMAPKIAAQMSDFAMQSMNEVMYKMDLSNIFG